MQRRNFLLTALSAALPLSLGRIAHADAAPLSLVLHPFNATPAYVEQHQGLVRFLEQKLQRKIRLSASGDFDAYFDGLMTGEFDVTICPPHFAVMAIQKAIYSPVMKFKRPLEPVLIVRKGSSMQQAAELAGSRIAMADRMAFLPIAVIRWLQDAGLTADKDYRLIEQPTFQAAIQLVLKGEADAALAGVPVLRLLPQEVQQQIRTIPTHLQLPNQFVLIHRRLGNATAGALKSALRDFSVDHADGKAFFDKLGLGGFDEISGETLAFLHPYAQTTRAMLMLIP